MKTALDYFLDYITYDTQSDENSETCPSTDKQLVLAKRLLKDLQDLGVEASLDENGYVMGKLPSNTKTATATTTKPKSESTTQLTLGLIAHMDTSPAMNGANVKAKKIQYEGGPIQLDDAGQFVMEPETFPRLNELKNKTLIVTDGQSLLGADNKAGLAAIMGLLAQFQANPNLKHGPIAVAFTPDEEIGRGAHRFDVETFGADVGYTIDGGEEGELEAENFNASSAKIHFQGRSVHPGSAKNRMINAMLLARDFANQLDDLDTPQHSEGYEGFFHLEEMKGQVEEAELSYIIRDFDEDGLAQRKTKLEAIAAKMNALYDEPRVTLEIKDQYRNMKEIVAKHPYLIELAKTAMEEEGVTPLIKPIRGGTDGSQLSYKGLPCPNIYTGGENFHGRFEYLCVESFEKLGAVLIRLCHKFSELNK